MTTIKTKLDGLIHDLSRMDSVLLAYSGGVDSTLLLKTLSISGVRAMAVTGVSAATPKHDIEDAKTMAASCGITHRIIETKELSRDEFAANNPDRCFHCKDELFSLLCGIAKAEGFDTVIEGTNADDARGHRPGLGAAARHNVISPLITHGFAKSDVRESSRFLGLSTWDKPSSPCLSSRIPYGERITADKLSRVARAEDYLRSSGFGEFRVRSHGDMARIECNIAEMQGLLNQREAIAARLREIGFKYVSLDLEGFRSGNMNRGIGQ